MNIKEYIDLIERNLYALKFVSNYASIDSSKPLVAEDLISLRQAIANLSVIELLEPEIEKLKSTALFSFTTDKQNFSLSDDTSIKNAIAKIQIGLEFIYRYVKDKYTISEEDVFIKLPYFETFDELSKISNELKKAIEIPISDLHDGGSVNVLSAESGSIWLTVSLGTVGAVNLIGAICWAAAIIKKKFAETKMFEEHARTLGLKNDSLSTIIEAQKAMVAHVIQHEAEAIAAKNYSPSDPEVIARIKLSISTVADLIDKGAKILPASGNSETRSLFPDYTQLGLIESSMRHLTSEGQTGELPS